MSKQYAVYRTEKGKGNGGGGLGNHIDRVKGMEHTFTNADPEALDKNINYPLPDGIHEMELSKAIKTKLEQNYNGKRKIRDDQVLYLTHLFSGSHETMKKLEGNKEDLDRWVEKNRKFVCEEFGEKNIVRVMLHLDEKTPHLHVVTVPITEDGRLSAKERVGNIKDLRERQTKYAEQMQEFGLERGKSTGVAVKHETTAEYRKRIANTENKAFKADISPVKSFLRIDKAKTIEKMSNQLEQAEKVIIQEIAKAESSEEKYNLVFERANKGLEDEQKKTKLLKQELENEKKKSFSSKQELTKQALINKKAIATLKSIEKEHKIDVKAEYSRQSELMKKDNRKSKNKGMSR